MSVFLRICQFRIGVALQIRRGHRSKAVLSIGRKGSVERVDLQIRQQIKHNLEGDFQALSYSVDPRVILLYPTGSFLMTKKAGCIGDLGDADGLGTV